MMKILWVSRHDMTFEQITDLKRIYGEDIEIEKLDETIKDIHIIANRDADVYAVVLPIDLAAELLTLTNKPVIFAVSERIRADKTRLNEATGKEEAEFIFKHVCWKKYDKVDIKTTVL